MKWRKVRNKREWKSDKGWRIVQEPNGNWQSFTAEGNAHIVWGNGPLAKCKKLCDDSQESKERYDAGTGVERRYERGPKALEDLFRI